ncbi:MAG: MinD/ParA family protein [Oligoflexales bacterium]
MNKLRKRFFVIAISSGKGGVGKTLTTVQMSFYAARMGKKVLILDGDLGLSNVDIVLGLRPRYNIYDVINGTAELKDILLEGPMGVSIIPTGSGISSLSELSWVEKISFFSELETISQDFDFMIIDAGAGIGKNVIHLNKISDQHVIVTTPEPHAMADAYAAIKTLYLENETTNFHILVNHATSDQEGFQTWKKLQNVAHQFLNCQLHFLGSVPHDQKIASIIAKQQPIDVHGIHTVSGQAWHKSFHNLPAFSMNEQNVTFEKTFWENFTHSDLNEEIR